MRILLLAPHPFFSTRGTPIAERELLRVLVGVGHEVDVLTYHEGEDLELPGCRIFRIPAPPGIRAVPPGPSWRKLVCDLFFLASLFRRLHTRRYDLIHACEESVLFALLARRLHSIPFVYDMDSSLPEQLLDAYPWIGPLIGTIRRLEISAVRNAAGILTVCRALSDLARSHGPDAPIGLAEDISLLERDPDREELPDDVADLDSRPVVAYVGNLASYQGVDLLLDAFERTAGERPDLRLLVVGGEGRALEEYRRRAARSAASERIRFLGRRPLEKLGSYLRVADIVVSPRLIGRNTPMKIYSYLDSGRPLVATRIPAHTQVLDEEIAELVDPEAEALAASLASLLASPERQRALAEAARRRVREEYSRPAFRRKVLAFYSELTGSLRSAERVAATSP